MNKTGFFLFKYVECALEKQQNYFPIICNLVFELNAKLLITLMLKCKIQLVMKWQKCGDIEKHNEFERKYVI